MIYLRIMFYNVVSEFVENTIETYQIYAQKLYFSCKSVVLLSFLFIYGHFQTFFYYLNMYLWTVKGVLNIGLILTFVFAEYDSQTQVKAQYTLDQWVTQNTPCKRICTLIGLCMNLCLGDLSSFRFMDLVLLSTFVCTYVAYNLLFKYRTNRIYNLRSDLKIYFSLVLFYLVTLTSTQNYNGSECLFLLEVCSSIAPFILQKNFYKEIREQIRKEHSFTGNRYLDVALYSVTYSAYYLLLERNFVDQSSLFLSVISEVVYQIFIDITYNIKVKNLN